MKSIVTDLYSAYYAPQIKESYQEDEAIFKSRFQKTWFALLVRDGKP